MPFVIIQCGSAARGDVNVNSDIDLVCIWSGFAPDFKKISEEYGEVMFYSQETIKRMKNKGSLFVTHLDVDGIFMAGDSALMSEVKGFRPSRRQVEMQYNYAKNFVLSLNWYPSKIIGKLWLCDVLYVSLRTCLYCKNALGGSYIFGYLDALAKCGLSEDCTRVMLGLREGKYRYRKNEVLTPKKNSPYEFDVRDIESACQSILEVSVRFVVGGRTEWEKIQNIDYWAERLIERAIINGEHCDEEFMRKMRNHNYHKSSLKKDIAKIIEDHALT